ncbi:MAG: Bug family tripartite tricarboxylate transporter substrate binding protein [bacterium]|jgi:tripartite-type tricarboxylate transporter receptor subunit TctC|nr:tripartite tricarboxylate transporter substrate binding protein [Betaproteobacteria bacterium]
MRIVGFAALFGAALLSGLLAATPLAAQSWPARPITMVNPYAAGAGVDPVARLVAQRLGERLGQPVVVENRTGAAGMIGAATVARAKPDGYTIMMSAAGDIAINQHLYKSMTYDAERDFAPITQAVRLPFLLAVHPSVPAKSLKDLIALAKARPDQLTYGSGGSGSLQHLAGALLVASAGVKMTHVPYKAVAPALVDLLGGQLSLVFAGVPAALPHVKAEKLRALGVTSTKRIEQAPEIPTIAEQGYPGFEIMQWFGVFAPAKTPPEIVERLYKEIAAVLSEPSVVETLRAQGAEPVASSPAEFAKFIRAEIVRFGKLVKLSGASVDQ